MCFCDALRNEMNLVSPVSPSLIGVGHGAGRRTALHALVAAARVAPAAAAGAAPCVGLGLVLLTAVTASASSTSTV